MSEAPAKRSTGESVKETLESVLIAFILAFVFRAFIVEAFVIPTGSMATTLLGAHTRYRCIDCGHQFDVSFGDSSLDAGSRRTTGHTPINAACDNCGYHVPEELARDIPVYYGDRILVLKYIYLLREPQRWDVVVFKSPTDQYRLRRPRAPMDRRPSDEEFTTNYIKRMVGKPGEWLTVYDGDVYTGDSPDGPWQIQAKPMAVQDAMWRLVYDNDYQPGKAPPSQSRDGRSVVPWVHPWQPTRAGNGWDTAGRTFAFTGRTEGEIEFLSLANRDPSSRRWAPMGDALAYNSLAFRDSAKVSDLKLALHYERQSGDGPLRLHLTKRGETFTAELRPDKVLLYRRSDGAAGPADAAPPLLQAAFSAPRGLPLSVEFMNVDHRITLRVNGRTVIQTTPREYAPQPPVGADNTSFAPGEVRISAAEQTCRVSHISLWRDVHYTVSENVQRATLHKPVHLRKKGQDGALDDEYFVLGDNSANSEDGRLWPTHASAIDLVSAENLSAPAGRVPGRFLIGKAFFVYWPAGYRPVSDVLPGLVPNFGEMRFIH